MTVASLNRSLDQELAALIRGVSLSASSAVSSSCTCAVRSPVPSAGRSWREARSRSRRSSYHPSCRPGDRGPLRLEESPDTAGQDAGLSFGISPGGESRRKVEQKGDRRWRETEAGKGETVG